MANYSPTHTPRQQLPSGSFAPLKVVTACGLVIGAPRQSNDWPEATQPASTIGYLDIAGQPARLVNAYAFAAAALSRYQYDPAARYAEQPGQETHQVIICLTGHRWGSNLDFKTITIDAGDSVAGRFWLDMDGQYQIGAIPVIPGSRRGLSQASNGRISILSTCRPIRANSGDRSIPEMGGMSCWIGLSTGAVRL